MHNIFCVLFILYVYFVLLLAVLKVISYDIANRIKCQTKTQALCLLYSEAV